MNVSNNASSIARTMPIELRTEAIEKFKSVILESMTAAPLAPQKQGEQDSVYITDIGKLLYELSNAGNVESKAIISSVIAGKPDNNLDSFMQAYCYIYGYDYSNKFVTYDRYGNGTYGEYYEALKKYLSTFGEYMLDEPEEDEVPGNLAKSFKKYLKKITKYLKS